jgi:hypothetical protein
VVSRKSHQRETTLSVIVEYCSDLGRRPVALRPIRPYQIVIHGPILPNSGPTRLTGLPDGYIHDVINRASLLDSQLAGPPRESALAALSTISRTDPSKQPHATASVYSLFADANFLERYY